MLTEVSLDKYDGVISGNRRVVKVFSFSGSPLDAIAESLKDGEGIKLKADERLASILGNETVSLVVIPKSDA